MLFTYSAELFSGEHIRYLLLLHTKNRRVSVLDLTGSNTALRETDASFLGLTWWTTSRKVWSNTTCRNNGSIAKTPCGEQGGWMLQITIYGILNTGFYLNNIFFYHYFSHCIIQHMNETTTWGFPVSLAELLKSANTLLNAVTEEWNFPQCAIPTCRNRSIDVHLTQRCPNCCLWAGGDPHHHLWPAGTLCLNWMLKVHRDFCWWLTFVQNPNNLGITIWDLSLISCEQNASPLCAFVSLPAPSALLN